MSTLAEMKEEVTRVNAENGWFDEDRTFGDGLALIHSEVSEALEAYRKWGLADATGDHEILGWSMGEAVEAPLAKPEGVGSEFADVLIRLLDECQRADIDLEYEFHRKMAYNKTRGYRHGGKRL